MSPEDKLFYLAVPYSGTPEEKEFRFHEVTKLTASLLGLGYNVFSPITHSHLLETKYGCFLSHADWMRMDIRYLSHCDGLLVYKMPGWEDSKGVQQEIKYAQSRDMDIVYFEFYHGMLEGNILKMLEA